jgi:hypothetical protein
MKHRALAVAWLAVKQHTRELREICVLGRVDIVEERADCFMLSWAVPLIGSERVLVSDIGKARRLDTLESAARSLAVRAEL